MFIQTSTTGIEPVLILAEDEDEDRRKNVLRTHMDAAGLLRFEMREAFYSLFLVVLALFVSSRIPHDAIKFKFKGD